MNGSRFERLLDRPAAVALASALTLALGLAFTFVWAPHPWGREGFDHYHQLALTLAAGQAFPTMEVPWGYAYFLAAFYRVFGDHPEIPLAVQALLNAAVPVLVFLFARPWAGRRTAALAALLCAAFSFNTVYASTQSSDAVCTVIFMTAVVIFASALRTGRPALFAGAGLLTGLAPQFRPNLVLIPVLLAAYTVWKGRSAHAAIRAGILLACAGAVLSPWVVRNYRLTRTFLPTSVHGGVQLWYGTLQVGPYLHSRAYNPRSVFDAPVFDYTTLADVPLVVTATAAERCGTETRTSASVVYWTDRDRTPRRIPLEPAGGTTERAEIGPPHSDAVVYYYFDTRWHTNQGEVSLATPRGGSATPLVYFVTQDHLGDLDVHGDLLDIFDIVRLVRHIAWGEPLAHEAELSSAGVSIGTVEPAIEALVDGVIDMRTIDGAIVNEFVSDDRDARLTLVDGSTIAVPRAWQGRITDLTVEGPLATRLLRQTVPLTIVAARAHPSATTFLERCGSVVDAGINTVFYRVEPQMMRRYSALSFDNIRRTPLAFAAATAYRAVRLFVILGDEDAATTQQFERSRAIYRIAAVVSAVYFLLFLVGAILLWRRGSDVLLPLALVLYIPATIAPVLTNMRYTITVQPIIFIFIAAAISALLQHAGLMTSPPGERDRAGTRTARQP